MDDEPIKVEIPITAGLIKDGINTIYNPAEKIIEHSTLDLNQPGLLQSSYPR